MNKRIVVSSVIALGLIGGGTVFALNNQSAKPVELAKTSNIQQVKTGTAKPDTTTTPTDAQPKVQKKATVIPNEDKTQTEQATTPLPDYGKDPKTGKYLVFNKIKLMNEAGIKSSDQPYADKVITHLSGWQYDGQWSRGQITLCTLPAVAMHAIHAPSDWRSNPVSQLKACDTYAKRTYGGWQQYAHDIVNNQGNPTN